MNMCTRSRQHRSDNPSSISGVEIGAKLGPAKNYSLFVKFETRGGS